MTDATQERMMRDVLVAYDHTFGSVNDYAEDVIADLKRHTGYDNYSLPKDNSGAGDAIQLSYLYGQRRIVEHILQRIEAAKQQAERE